MNGRHSRGGDPRRNLAELEPDLRERLRALDEPVARDDWDDVVQRSSRHRPFAGRGAALALAATVGAAAVIAGATLGLGVFAAGHGSPQSGAASAAPAAGLVLYSKAQQAQFMDFADNRASGATTMRWLVGFNARLPVTSESGKPPKPGDESLLRFSLYTSSDLKELAGSGVLMCRYATGANALCNASFELHNGNTLTASGVLDAAAGTFSLALTGGSGSFVSRTGDVEETAVPNHGQRLSFRFA